MRERDISVKPETSYWEHKDSGCCKESLEDYRKTPAELGISVDFARKKLFDYFESESPVVVRNFVHKELDNPYNVPFEQYTEWSIFRYKDEFLMREGKERACGAENYYGVLIRPHEESSGSSLKMVTFRIDTDSSGREVIGGPDSIGVFPYEYFRLGEAMHAKFTKLSRSLFMQVVATPIERFDRISELELMKVGMRDPSQVRQLVRDQEERDKNVKNRYADAIRKYNLRRNKK